MTPVSFSDENGTHTLCPHRVAPGHVTVEIFRRTYTLKRIGTKKWLATRGTADNGESVAISEQLNDALSSCFEHAVQAAKVVLPYGTCCRVSVEVWEDGKREDRNVGIFTDRPTAEAWIKANPDFKIGSTVLSKARVFCATLVLNDPNASQW